jgi:hypothetical protein
MFKNQKRFFLDIKLSIFVKKNELSHAAQSPHIRWCCFVILFSVYSYAIGRRDTLSVSYWSMVCQAGNKLPPGARARAEITNCGSGSSSFLSKTWSGLVAYFGLLGGDTLGLVAYCGLIRRGYSWSGCLLWSHKEGLLLVWLLIVVS